MKNKINLKKQGEVYNERGNVSMLCMASPRQFWYLLSIMYLIYNKLLYIYIVFHSLFLFVFYFINFRFGYIIFFLIFVSMQRSCWTLLCPLPVYIAGTRQRAIILLKLINLSTKGEVQKYKFIYYLAIFVNSEGLTLFISFLDCASIPHTYCP